MALSNEQWNAPSGAADFYDHQIANSSRFNKGDSPLMSMTPGAAGDRKTWTVSFWIKRTGLGSGNNPIMAADTGGSGGAYASMIRFDNSGHLGVTTGTSVSLKTNMKFRDTSAWYHIVVASDTTQSTNTDRWKIFVNGEDQTGELSDTGYPAEDYQFTMWGNGAPIYIGRDGGSAYSLYSNFTIAEVAMTEGTAHNAGTFGEAKNGVWIPKDLSGITFGDEGFWLQMKQSAVGTGSSSTVGADTSGNNNHFTTANQATTDHLLDSPTFGSSNGGNFASWNILSRTNPALQYGTSLYSEGATRFAGGTDGSVSTATTLQMQSGKWYVELCPIGAPTSGWPCAGLVYTDQLGVAQSTSNLQPTNAFTSWVDLSAGTIYDFAGNGSAAYGASLGDGDILNIAVDVDAGKVWWGKNGTYFDSGNPAGGSGEGDTFAAGRDVSFHAGIYSGAGVIAINAGQDGSFAGAKTAQGNTDGNGYGNFFYAPPSGFLALCTANLPIADEIDPAQTDDDFPQKLFSTTLYTGNDTTNNITGVGFQPDLLLFKIRSTASSGMWVDTNRARTTASYSINNDAEITIANITAIGSDGFSLDGTSDYKPNFNNNTHTYVAWAWRANGGSTSTNSTGSVNVTQQVDPSGSFSISTYSGAGGTGTIGHGLSRAATFVIIKQRNGANNWAVYAKGAANTNYAYLDTTAAFGDATMWQDTTPSNTLVYLGDNNEVNHANRTYVAYCFADTEGYIQSGTYEGNGNADGAFVYTGFRPALIITKSVDSTSNWQVFDDKREGYNVDNDELYINIHDAEATTDMIDIVSNGFKCRIATDPNVAETYIYLAFAHNPLKYATAR